MPFNYFKNYNFHKDVAKAEYNLIASFTWSTKLQTSDNCMTSTILKKVDVVGSRTNDLQISIPEFISWATGDIVC